MAEWGPVVAEELRRDVRFALGWKVGKKPRPLTDTERDMVADAIVEHKAMQLESRTRAAVGGICVFGAIRVQGTWHQPLCQRGGLDARFNSKTDV